MPGVVHVENLGSGPTPARPEPVPWWEAKEFQESLEAEGQVVLRAYVEHQNIRHLVATMLYVLDQAGDRHGQDPTRADLEIGWTREGVLVLTPTWSAIQDRIHPAAGDPDQVIARLLAAPKIRGQVAALIGHLVAYCRSKGVPLGKVDFEIRERSDGAVGIGLYGPGRRPLTHGGDDVAWEVDPRA